MPRIFRHLRVLLHAESAMAEARLRIVVRRSLLLGLAGLIAVFGLCMLNAAAFLALESVWGPVWAALAAALGDFVLAALIGVVALTLRTAPELQSALELRQAALDGIESEFSGRRDRVSSAYGSLETILPAVLLPLMTAIIRGLRKHKTEA